MAKPNSYSSVTARAQFDPVLWLVHHTNQGFLLDELKTARSMGYEAYLEQQLAPEKIDDSEFEEELARYPSLKMSGRQVHDTYLPGGALPDAMNELKGAMFYRSMKSKRQLYERMCEFWTDHFNIDHKAGVCNFMKTVDDRDVIRKHALGNFRELLEASARSAAMLYYLDNYDNKASGPNENYAREVMELHTLGVDNGYTEKDVYEVARAFTGWTFQWVDNPDFGEFAFRKKYHDFNEKLVLGRSFQFERGLDEGEAVLDLLALHPNTAGYLARKLASWLLTYDPPEAVVQRAAKAFLEAKGEIQAMVRAILLPPIAEPLQPKLRRPYHFAVSLLRSLRAHVTDTDPILTELRLMGQQPYNWPTPDGYPDALDAWGDSLYPRWDFAHKVLEGKLEGCKVEIPAVFEPVGGFDRQRGAQLINQVLTGGTLTAEDQADVQAFLDEHDSIDDTVVKEALALAACSPSYQYY